MRADGGRCIAFMFAQYRRITLRTVNARTLTSSNVASFFTSEVKTYGGFYMIMTSTALADIIVKQVRAASTCRESAGPARELHYLVPDRSRARSVSVSVPHLTIP